MLCYISTLRNSVLPS